MSAIRSASSMAVDLDVGEVAGALVGVVGEPARGGDQQVDPALGFGGLAVERHAATTEVTSGPAPSRTAPRRPRPASRAPRWGRESHGAGATGPPPASRESIARPKARVLPEPVWPRPSRSRPARVSGSVAAWMGNGAVKPPASSARSTGWGRPSSAKVGIPVSGTVQSTSAGITGADASAGAPAPREPREERGRPPPEGRRDGEAFAGRGARPAKGEDKKNLRDVARRAKRGSAVTAAEDHSGRARARGGALMGEGARDGLGHDGRALGIDHSRAPGGPGAGTAVTYLGM